VVIYYRQNLLFRIMPEHDKRTKKLLEDIGNRMRELRKEQGFGNYEQFAFEHELPRTQYGRYEKGGDLRVSSLIKVLDAFDISLSDFFKNFDD